MDIGFIGLGRMGTPMAANLVAAGHAVRVWNRTASKAEAFAAEHGAEAVGTAAELAAASEVVITMVADGPVLEAVYTGEDGVLAGLGEGAVAIDMSTVGPGAIESLRPHVEARGATLVDAPVSGSTAAAEAKTLMIMAAGTSDAVERVRPVLEAIGTPVLRVGESGAGATMKLAINSMIYAINEAVSEAMVLAENSGIERAVALDAFTKSAASSPMLNYRRPIYENPGSIPVTFTVDLASKDLRLALELAAANGTPMPGAEVNLRVMEETSAAGMGDDDMGMTAEYLRRG
jgi:3-hydroxyisobutyrate dehydrogenase-like beta-hydroxyacid dehydrogenase